MDCRIPVYLCAEDPITRAGAILVVASLTDEEPRELRLF